jgi:TetR/AcrR family transcriptional repressor of nem operon
MGRKLQFDREKALQKAMEGFWSKGYEDTSMRDLAHRMELHLGSVYNTLGSKEQVFEAAFRLYFETHVLPKLTAMTSHPNPLEALQHYMDTIANECTQSGENQGGFMMNSLDEITKINDSITTFLHACLSHIEEAFASTIASAQIKGDISPKRDSRKLARFFVATIFSMQALVKMGVSADRIHDVKDCAIESIKG